MPRRSRERPAPWVLPGLGADGPDPALRDQLQLFGQFVGDWDIDRRWVEPDGSERRNTGRVHFRWILGGRAVQDVWSAIEGDPPEEAAVGTTIRSYDPEKDAWTSLWIAPKYGLLVRFTVPRVGSEIVLETHQDGYPER